MRANRSYRLLHTRSSRRPASLDPARIDHLEVVDVASGEVVLFWDLPAPAAAQRAPPGGPAPARIHRLEVVEVASGEGVLFWDLPAPEAAKRARRLREELASL